MTKIKSKKKAHAQTVSEMKGLAQRAKALQSDLGATELEVKFALLPQVLRALGPDYHKWLLQRAMSYSFPSLESALFRNRHRGFGRVEQGPFVGGVEVLYGMQYMIQDRSWDILQGLTDHEAVGPTLPGCTDRDLFAYVQGKPYDRARAAFVVGWVLAFLARANAHAAGELGAEVSLKKDWATIEAVLWSPEIGQSLDQILFSGEGERVLVLHPIETSVVQGGVEFNESGEITIQFLNKPVSPAAEETPMGHWSVPDVLVRHPSDV